MSVTDKLTPTIPAKPQLAPTQLRALDRRESTAQLPPADDGTYALLKAGFWIVLIALLSLIATLKLFGGIGIYGAHSNAGWLSLMFAMMGTPFGLMLLLLGVAKWLRNRHQNK